MIQNVWIVKKGILNQQIIIINAFKLLINAKCMMSSEKCIKCELEYEAFGNGTICKIEKDKCIEVDRNGYCAKYV